MPFQQHGQGAQQLVAVEARTIGRFWHSASAYIRIRRRKNIAASREIIRAIGVAISIRRMYHKTFCCMARLIRRGDDTMPPSKIILAGEAVSRLACAP